MTMLSVPNSPAVEDKRLAVPVAFPAPAPPGLPPPALPSSSSSAAAASVAKQNGRLPLPEGVPLETLARRLLGGVGVATKQQSAAGVRPIVPPMIPEPLRGEDEDDDDEEKDRGGRATESNRGFFSGCRINLNCTTTLCGEILF